MDDKPNPRRAAAKRWLSWRVAGEATLALLRIAAGVVALYGALKGGGLV